MEFTQQAEREREKEDFKRKFVGAQKDNKIDSKIDGKSSRQQTYGS
jgi:hypothetical protein